MPFSLGFEKRKKDEVYRVGHTDPGARASVAEQIGRHLAEAEPDRDIAIVCVGTDRSTGDALGPLVGTRLQRASDRSYHVYGTLDDPVHALNLSERINTLLFAHRNPYIIAVDACLGQVSSIGTIQFGVGPVKPGAGVNKELPPVGHIHLTGIVNVGGFMEYFVLQNTRLSLVMHMADVMADAIRDAVVQRRERPRRASGRE